MALVADSNGGNALSCSGDSDLSIGKLVSRNHTNGAAASIGTTGSVRIGTVDSDVCCSGPVVCQVFYTYVGTSEVDGDIVVVIYEFKIIF